MPVRVTLQELAMAIKHRAKHGRYWVIALSGFAGAGKTTTAQALADTLKDAVIVHVDDFIRNRLTERSDSWAGFDWGRFVEQVLLPISYGADTIEYGVYCWETNRADKTNKLILPTYVIVEGVGIIRDEWSHFFDVRVWIDVPMWLAGERGRRRDREPGDLKLWKTILIPNDQDYFMKHHPNQRADFLLENN